MGSLTLPLLASEGPVRPVRWSEKLGRGGLCRPSGNAEEVRASLAKLRQTFRTKKAKHQHALLKDQFL